MISTDSSLTQPYIIHLSSECQARECQNHLADSIGTNYSLRIQLANKALEVRPLGITKGNAVRQIMSKESSFDLIFCASNDRTEKDLFDYLHLAHHDDLCICITSTVDANFIRASCYTSDPSDLVKILHQIVHESTTPGKLLFPPSTTILVAMMIHPCSRIR
jgi:hypothetical protein